MNLICSKSSIAFTCEHFPGTLDSPDSVHPVFHIPQKRLLSYLGKWVDGGLTPTDSYLLYLSLLNSTDHVVWRTGAIRTTSTASIVSNHLEGLAHVVSRMNAITNPHVVFPHYVISRDTCDLSTTPYWIENWNDSYKAYIDGARNSSAHELSKLNRRDSALTRLITNKHKHPSTYARQLGEWAATAASFPTFNTVSRFNGQSCSCSDYWIEIITRCATETGVFEVNENDLLELTNHCETNIPVSELGSSFSMALLRILRRAQDKVKNFLGLHDLDVPRHGVFGIINPTDSTESANIRALIMGAPESAPKRENYPTKLAFMKAKMNWDLMRRHGRESAQIHTESNIKDIEL